MGIKAAGALATIGVFTLAARAMSADEFGRLAIWFNAVSLLAVAAVFGQDTLIARSWGEYSGRGEHDVARAAYRFGWRVTLSSSAIFALGLLVGAPLADAGVALDARVAAAAYLLTQTLLHYSSHSSRVLVGFVISEINRELTWRLVLILAVLWAILHHGLTLAQFFWAGVVGMALSVAFQSLAVRRKFVREPVEGRASSSPGLVFPRRRNVARGHRRSDEPICRRDADRRRRFAEPPPASISWPRALPAFS